MKSDAYAYRDRRARKRDFRSLWIVRINAAARREGISYSQLMAGLREGRHRGQPQDARRHRRARPRDVPPICRASQGGPGGGGRRILTRSGSDASHGRPALAEPPFFVPGQDDDRDDHKHTQPPLKELRDLRERKRRGTAAGCSWPRARTCSTEALRARRPAARPSSTTRTRSRPATPPLDVLPARGGARARRPRSALASAGSLGSGSRVIGVWRQRWSGRRGRRRAATRARTALYLARRRRPRQRRRGPALGVRVRRRRAWC